MSEALFTTLKAANRLPSPPAVAMRILQLVSEEDTTLEELAQVISTDPALTAKILKYLHSPLIGLGFEGKTLLEAVARIGTRGTQLLALSFSLISQKQQQSCPSFSPSRFWSESLARAVAARNLARATRQWSPDEAFVTGLVFRLGQLVLATVVPADYEPVLHERPGSTAMLEEREWQAFGCDHVELGRQLLKHWKLPESIWGLFAPSEGRAAPAETLLRLSDALALFIARSEQQHGRNMDVILDLMTAETNCERYAATVFLEQTIQDWLNYGSVLAVNTGAPPDLDALEAEAEEYRTALRLATELEVHTLRSENRQLSYLASRDRLTGLLNRGAFDQALAAGLRQATQQTTALALLMVDVDQFGSIAERHGHPAADAVLRRLAKVLTSHAKPPAEAFRYSGEEFAIVVPGATYDQAAVLAEKLREAVGENTPAQSGQTVPFTISVGVAAATWPDRPQNAEALVAAAGARLFEAKDDGGNAVR